MTNTTQFYSPEYTPKVLQILIWTTCIVSIAAALINPLFINYFNMNGPQELLSLSQGGLRSFFLWQPITYLFVQPGGGYGINLLFVISLLFNMYILWFVGSTVIHHGGKNAFIWLYLLSGVFAGFCALGIMAMGGIYGYIAGCTPAIFALLVVWAMLNPEAEVMFFFLFNMKAKWLVVGILGAFALICLSQLDLVTFTLIFSGALFGYLFGVLIFDLEGPFAFSHRFEGAIKGLRPRKSSEVASKIYDLKTGKARASDDEFIDAMLAKISKHGEKSLSWREKRRMKKISESRKNK